MKKIFLILLLFLLVGCSKKENTTIKPEVIEEPQKEVYIDDNPIKLGLFLYDNNYHSKKVLKTYETNFISGVDIGSFEVFFTDEEVIDGNKFKDTWNKYYNQYENIEDYKVGFNIKYTLKDGTSNGGNFLEPDIFRYGDYFYVYLYDDINQKDGAFYSHLEEMTSENIITSVKLYAVDGIDEVGQIDLTAFTYKSDNDFKNNIYRGNSTYSVKIKRS